MRYVLLVVVASVVAGCDALQRLGIPVPEIYYRIVSPDCEKEDTKCR